MNINRNYAIEIKMLMKTGLEKKAWCWQWTMLKASKANKAEAYLNRGANNKLKKPHVD